MRSMGAEPRRGVNEFIQNQREFSAENKNIPCLVSVTRFDSVIETIIKNQPISNVREVTPTDLMPRGRTALVDAIFKAVRDVESQSPDDHPTSKRTVFIITDGMDNASQK